MLPPIVVSGVILGILLGGCRPDAWTVTPVQASAKNPNIVRVSAEQMRQLNVVRVELYPFRLHKPAIGQIAFNDDASTIVQTPFSGRVTRVLAKIGVTTSSAAIRCSRSTVRKWCKAQTDLIAALHGLDKAKSQLNAAQRPASASSVVRDLRTERVAAHLAGKAKVAAHDAWIKLSLCPALFDYKARRVSRSD